MTDTPQQPAPEERDAALRDKVREVNKRSTTGSHM